MLPRTRRFDAWRGASLLAFLVLLVGCGRWSKSPVPSISFSRVPAADEEGYDKFATIEGIARGFHPGQQIVLYSKSEELWWLQPITDHPFTKIQGDSTWKSQIHLGTEYAALLVDPGYNPPETSETLPSPGSGIEAIEVVKGQGALSPPASPKTVTFSGYEWTVRLQEKVVARTRTAAIGIVHAGSVGEPATARSAGSFESGDCGADAGDRAAKSRTVRRRSDCERTLE